MSHAPAPPDPDKLAAAVAAFQTMPAPDRPADDSILARLAAEPAPEPLTRSRRKLLMRVATWSLAASVLAAVGGVLLFGGSAPVALADVLKAAEKHKLVKYTQTQTVETKDGGAVIPLVQTVYADLKAPRSRTVQRVPGHLSGAIDFEGVSVWDGTKNLALHITTETVTEKGKTDPKLVEMLKGFEQVGVPRKEAALDAAPHNKTFLESTRELEEHKDAVATKTKVAGKDVLVCRIEGEKTTTVLRVDAGTKLPVRLEYEIETPGADVQRTRIVMSGFEWDPPLPAGMKAPDDLFSTTPPAGYKVEDRRKNKPDPQPAARAVPEKP